MAQSVALCLVCPSPQESFVRHLHNIHNIPLLLPHPASYHTKLIAVAVEALQTAWLVSPSVIALDNIIICRAAAEHRVRIA